MNPIHYRTTSKRKRPREYPRYLDLKTSIKKSQKRRCALQVYSFAIDNPILPLAKILLPYSIVASRFILEQFISDHEQEGIAVQSVSTGRVSNAISHDGVVIYLPDRYLRAQICQTL